MVYHGRVIYPWRITADLQLATAATSLAPCIGGRSCSVHFSVWVHGLHSGKVFLPWLLSPSRRMLSFYHIRRWDPSLSCIRTQVCNTKVLNVHLPKLVDPLGRTMAPWLSQLDVYRVVTMGFELTSVLPWKMRGSSPGPRQKANVHTASAVLSSKPSSILFRPSRPKASMNDLLGIISGLT